MISNVVATISLCLGLLFLISICCKVSYKKGSIPWYHMFMAAIGITGFVSSMWIF